MNKWPETWEDHILFIFEEKQKYFNSQKRGMLCFSCKTSSPFGMWYPINIGGSTNPGFIATRPFVEHLGLVGAFACPVCGTLRIDFKKEFS